MHSQLHSQPVGLFHTMSDHTPPFGGKLLSFSFVLRSLLHSLDRHQIGSTQTYTVHGFQIGGLNTRVYDGTSQEGKYDIFFYRKL